jgi:hypothetical protein
VTSPEPDDDATPTTIKRACLLLTAESVALLGACLAVLVLTVVHDTTRLWAAFVIALFAFAGAAFLWFAARGLRHLHAGYRSPVVLLQLLAIPVAVGLLQGGRWVIGVPILAVVLAVIHQLFSAPSRAVLDRPPV